MFKTPLIRYGGWVVGIRSGFFENEDMSKLSQSLCEIDLDGCDETSNSDVLATSVAWLGCWYLVGD